MDDEKTVQPSVDEDSLVNEDQVELAVRFLQDGSRQDTEIEKKVAFLKKKGLSESAIESALLRCHEQTSVNETNNSWSILKTIKNVAIGLGFLSAANYAYKAYLLPYIAKEVNDDKRLETIGESIQVLQDDIKQHSYELNSSLKLFSQLLEEQQKLINELTKVQQQAVASDCIKDVKCEIESVKNLLLNANQFPSTPFSSSSVKTVPSWQIAQQSSPSESKTASHDVSKMESNKLEE